MILMCVFRCGSGLWWWCQSQCSSVWWSLSASRCPALQSGWSWRYTAAAEGDDITHHNSNEIIQLTQPSDWLTLVIIHESCCKCPWGGLVFNCLRLKCVFVCHSFSWNRVSVCRRLQSLRSCGRWKRNVVVWHLIMNPRSGTEVRRPPRSNTRFLMDGSSHSAQNASGDETDSVSDLQILAPDSTHTSGRRLVDVCVYISKTYFSQIFAVI